MTTRLTLSPRARERVLAAVAEQGKPAGSFLRFRLFPGRGPSGFEFGLDIDDRFSPETDVRLPGDQVDVVVDRESLRWVEASVLSYEIDYEDGPHGRGFKLNHHYPDRSG